MTDDARWEKEVEYVIFDTRPDTLGAVRQAALALGRRMADERSEEIAIKLCVRSRECSPMNQSHPWDSEAFAEAAHIARSTISKPKTREQVLEEALRFYASRHLNAGNSLAEETSPGSVARAALDWKP